MKLFKYLLTWFLVFSPAIAEAQSLPSPSYKNVTAQKSTVGATSPWWESYLPGSNAGVVSTIVNPLAKWGSFLSAARSSDNTGTVDNILSDTCLAVADNLTIAHNSWCRYSQGVITSAAHFGLYMGEENSVQNLGTDAPGLDPFSTAGGTNPAKMIVNLRLDNGIGNATPSQKISAFLNLTNNSKASAGSGGEAKAGIVIASDALDTSSGIGSAIQMGPNHAIDWYNAASTLGWRIARLGNTGSGNITLGNNRFDLFLNGANDIFRATTTGIGINADPAYPLDVAGTARASQYIVNPATQVLSGCGTGAAMTANSSKHGGRFSTGSGTVTACTLTFDTAFPTSAFCAVTAVGGVTAYYISSQTAAAFTLTFPVSAPSTSWQYVCMGS